MTLGIMQNLHMSIETCDEAAKLVKTALIWNIATESWKHFFLGICMLCDVRGHVISSLTSENDTLCLDGGRRRNIFLQVTKEKNTTILDHKQTK